MPAGVGWQCEVVPPALTPEGRGALRRAAPPPEELPWMFEIGARPASAAGDEAGEEETGGVDYELIAEGHCDESGWLRALEGVCEEALDGSADCAIEVRAPGPSHEGDGPVDQVRLFRAERPAQSSEFGPTEGFRVEPFTDDHLDLPGG